MTFKERVLNREILNGTHINLNDPSIAGIVGSLGFDYVWIDMEHSYLSYENLLSHIMTIKALGTAVIVRCPQNDFTAAKKIIEMGPDGIIFPMVRTKEEADAMISYTLYPPYGTRGFGPINAVRYGLDNVKEYVDNNHKTMARFIQIEHKSLVDDLDRVSDNPYIDGYIFGPNDLSGSINEILDVFGENNMALIKKSIDILNKKGKCIGLSTGSNDVEIIRKWRKMGIHMLSAGADWDMLAMGMKNMIETLKKAQN